MVTRVAIQRTHFLPWWPAATFAVLALALGLSGGCDESRGTPWIEPVLHGWDAAYSGLPGLEIHVFNTGKMRLPAGVIQRGASLFETREIEIPAYVIRHPTEGLIVFDTGLQARSDAATAERMLAGVLESEPAQDLPTQMEAAGLSPDEVRFVVLSHLHFDHTGCIGAFTNAEIVVAAAELSAARTPQWWNALFFHAHDYEDVSRCREIDYDATEPLATFDGHVDLLGDASIRLVDLAGHTPGSQGLLVATPSWPVLLTGDASYVDASWRYGVRPLLAYDMDAWWLVSWKIKKFSQLMPSLVVLPGHDLKAARRVDGEVIIYHPFDSDETQAR